MQYGSKLLPWYGEFLERLVSDFPDLSTDDLLLSVLKLPIEGSDLAKYELLYNLITNLAPENPQKALTVFKMFKRISGENLHVNAVECIIDAALNIIVGVEQFEFEKAFEIYKLTKQLTVNAPPTLQTAQSWCDLLSSLIGKFPASDPKPFRTVLAHAIQQYRLFPKDDELRKEVCAAIANFVNLLDESQLETAIRLLRRFIKLAVEDETSEMQMAWEHVLYHVFILHIAQYEADEITQENVDLAIKKMTALVPDFSRYEATMLALLHKDMAEDTSLSSE